MEEKYDLSKDGRITGKPERLYVRIECPLCEDEGLVYFYLPGPRGPRRWTARCTCHPADDVRIPKEYRRAVTPNKVEWVNLAWNEVKGGDGAPVLREPDLLPSRLLCFTDAQGRLDCGIEPRYIEFRQRRHGEPQVQP